MYVSGDSYNVWKFHVHGRTPCHPLKSKIENFIREYLPRMLCASAGCQFVIQDRKKIEIYYVLYLLPASEGLRPGAGSPQGVAAVDNTNVDPQNLQKQNIYTVFGKKVNLANYTGHPATRAILRRHRAECAENSWRKRTEQRFKTVPGSSGCAHRSSYLLGDRCILQFCSNRKVGMKVNLFLFRDTYKCMYGCNHEQYQNNSGVFMFVEIVLRAGACIRETWRDACFHLEPGGQKWSTKNGIIVHLLYSTSID